MYYEVHNAKICRKHYRPATGILTLIKNVWTVLILGESPIGNSSLRRRRH